MRLESLRRRFGGKSQPVVEVVTSSTRKIHLVGLVTLFAFYLRIVGVGVPPLLDGESIIGIAATSVARTAENMLPAGHPYKRGELLTLVTGISIWLFGKSAFALRLPIVLIGTVSVPVIYLTGRELFDDRVGVIAAVFQSFALVNVAWARTIRFYALLQLFILGGVLLYLRLRAVTDIDYQNRDVTLVNKRAAVSYLGLLVAVMAIGSQVHRGWIILPAVLGLHAVLPGTSDSVVVRRLKYTLCGIIGINILYIVLARDILLPSSLLEVVGFEMLDSVAIWQHPMTEAPPHTFYFDYFPAISILALTGSLIVLWRRRQTELLGLVGLYIPLFLFTYFGENFRFIWRPRYLLLTLPFFFLLGAMGLVSAVDWTVARTNVREAIQVDSIDLPTRNIALACFAILLVLTPISQGIQLTADPHTLSRIEEPRPNYKGACELVDGEVHSGDVVITNRPNQIYFWLEKVDYRGNRHTAEWTAVPGRDHYTGATIINNISEMQQVIRENERVWVIYNPFTNLIAERWIRQNMSRYAVAESPFENRFPQGLYDEYRSGHQSDERVYVYTKGIETEPPQGQELSTTCGTSMNPD